MNLFFRERKLVLLSFIFFFFITNSAIALVVFEKDKVTLQTSTTKINLDIELALTAEQKEQGLMFRTKLAADSGMLFIFQPAQFVQMWMKNTYIPLDMLFIDNQGKIVSIAERRVPLSTQITSSTEPVMAVLELNGGVVEKLGVKKGDMIYHRFFNNVLP
ncbi:MAG: DUF192 domain-containing protein [Alphaproteobacteria bacterium]|nr:DUF192 domain-containing protein [Alphaproteobacteria bacterium]